MRSLLRFACVMILPVLTACSTVSQEPVPVEERPLPRQDEEGPSAAIEKPERLPAETAPDEDRGDMSTAVSDSPVVLALLEEADQKQQAGRRDASVSLLERALAQEPRNADLWHRLASLHLEQENWQQAYVMANKSNSLVHDNPALKLENWKIIATAKRQQGDGQAVKQAEEEIRRLREGEE